MKEALRRYIDLHLRSLASDIPRLECLAGCPELAGDMSFFRELAASSRHEQDLLCDLAKIPPPKEEAAEGHGGCTWEMLESALIEHRRREVLWRNLAEVYGQEIPGPPESLEEMHGRVKREAETLDDKFRLLARAVFSSAP